MTVPGHAGLIAYTHTLTDDIWLMNADGRFQRPLFRDRVPHSDPAWSPRGRWLMYTGDGLWIARADGTKRRRLGPYASDGSWAPDGTRVVFVGAFTKRGCTDIYSMRLDGKDVRKLTSTRACEHDPSFSPDGESIVFRATTDYATHVVVKKADGTGAAKVIGAGHSPDWSPDGRAVAYAAGTRVLVVNVEGRVLSELELRSPEHIGITDVAWSPRGDRFVVAQTHSPTGCSIGVCRAGTPIYTVAVDGSDRRQLTFPGIDHDVEPTWQPLPPTTR